MPPIIKEIEELKTGFAIAIGLPHDTVLIKLPNGREQTVGDLADWWLEKYRSALRRVVEEAVKELKTITDVGYGQPNIPPEEFGYITGWNHCRSKILAKAEEIIHSLENKQ